MTARAARLAAIVPFAHALVAAVQNRQLHGADHRFVLDGLVDLVAALRAAAEAGADMPLRLQFDDDRIYHEGEPLVGPSLQARTLLHRCRERNIAAIAFHRGLEAEEANRFLDLLLLEANIDSFARAHRERAMSACGVRNVHVTLRSAADPGDRRAAVDADARALHHYQDLAESLQQNVVRAHRDLELAVDEARGAVEQTLSDLDEPSLLLSLATQDDVDRFTIGHSVRVALLALQVARSLGADRDRLVQVGTAALLHDIGKSKVPQEVLWKRGRLDDDEWHAMSQHPRLGAEILLEQHTHVDPYAIGAAFCHHMAPNGGGYPHPALPLRPSGISCLVRVCDVFEALTAIRPYKLALSPIEAYAVMYRNERDFHPGWLRRFTQTIGLFPTGMRVHLDDGSLAVVTGQTACVERPRVRLLTGAGGSDLAPDQPRDLVVGEPQPGAVRRVLGIDMPTHCVEVPEFEPTDLAIARTVHGACLTDDDDGC